MVLSSRSTSNYFCVVALCMLIIGAAAAKKSWLSQDAFISLRYVENVHEGHGLVFNPGERVQGFTHPLWLLLLCMFPPQYSMCWAQALGILCTCLTVAVLGWTWRDCSYRTLALTAAVAILVTSRSYREWSTGGLENSLLHLALALLIATISRQRATVGWAIFLGITTSIVCLTRMDHLLLISPLLFATALKAWRIASLRRISLGFVIGLLPLAVWILFAAWYFGFPLPNTAHAKVVGASWFQVAQGIRYFGDYLLSEPAHFLVILAAMLWLPVRRIGDWPQLHAIPPAMTIGIILQVIYLTYIGGDYMRGRFLTGLLLVAAFVVSGTIAQAFQAAPRRAFSAMAALGAFLGGGWIATRYESPYSGWSGVARVSFDYKPFPELESFPQYAQLRTAKRKLSALTKYCSHFGAFPIRYSNLGDDTFGLNNGLRIVDTLGLTDPFIARCRPSRRNRPGHVLRDVPLSYYEARGCLDLVADWLPRLDKLDPSLAIDATSMKQAARWRSGEAERVYRELDLLTRGSLFDPRRIPLIFKYTFTSPRAYGTEDDALPVFTGNEVIGLLRVQQDLRDSLVVDGINPSQWDLMDPLGSGKFWLATGADGGLAIYVTASRTLTVRLRADIATGPAFLINSTQLIATLDSHPVCPVSISAATSTLDICMVLSAGRHEIGLKLSGTTKPDRFWHDSRPLTIYVSNLVLLNKH